MMAGEEVLAGFDAAISRDSGSVDPETCIRVAQALVDKGNALIDLNRYDEAIACFEGVVAEYAQAEEAELRECAARALRRKAHALIKLGRRDEAIVVHMKLASTIERPVVRLHATWRSDWPSGSAVPLSNGELSMMRGLA
jgi:tetratricopeptide (TPR) repeat protein